MAETARGVNQLGIVLERISDLRGDMQDTREQLKGIAKEIADFRLLYTSEYHKLAALSNTTNNRLDDHEIRLKSIEQTMPQLVMVSKILIFVGSVVAAAIIGLIWTILTHQITLIYP